ncbi:MAG: DUF4116 domain-containing protein [Legionella sp.]|nr:DUF4116 domain-containing protein [Legionella sp.]
MFFESDFERYSVLSYINRTNGLGLRLVPKQYKQDEAVVWSALTKNIKALRFASPDLLNNLDFMLKALEYNPDALEYASEEVRNKLAFQDDDHDTVAGLSECKEQIDLAAAKAEAKAQKRLSWHRVAEVPDDEQTEDSYFDNSKSSTL